MPSPQLTMPGVTPPPIPADMVPGHVAIVMDGNGRWANARGLPRTEGHKTGEPVLLDIIAGAIEIGVKELSAYAFSTENWSRSPSEVRFLMGFNRDVIHRQRDTLHEWGVRVRWAGRKPRLWRSVINELEIAENLTKKNTGLVVNMCVNYGGRAEIADAAAALARDAAAGTVRPDKITPELFASYLYQPMSDIDLFWRTGGEKRLSNFLLWQTAYAEIVVTDKPWPEVDRRDLWEAITTYAKRHRRWGGAVDMTAGADDAE
ncbi:isoprenyl transferase [Flaviflexus huanghaiensis]|uniref:isoprenyl transferase n=1 Tax=Flaviflexus huanghaiensis TaxID=1111473 RepID=UPI0015FE3A7D|nr:isoprenyl transferase [Flaviflexus huanghaiensis]